MSDYPKQTGLESLPPVDLRRVGFENPADLRYRVEIARRLAERHQAKKTLLFDDVAYAVPEDQRPKLKGLPGYERALLPGLLLAPGFENGASVLVAAPPNPIEMRVVKQLKEQLEKQLGRNIPFEILFEYQGELVDLTNISEEDYFNFCCEYASKLDSEEALRDYKPSHHLEIADRHPEIFTERTLVVPFQTTKYHYERLSSNPNILLPSIPIMDKVINNFQLRDNGFTDIPEMIAVASNGKIINTSEELSQYLEESGNRFQLTDDAVYEFASGILTALEQLEAKGKSGYIKLDSNGVSGLGNLSVKKNPDIYNKSKSPNERLSLLINAIKTSGIKEIPQMAVVEECVEAEYVEGIKHDITVGGIMIGGEFYPMSLNPFGVNENDEYIYSWMSTDPQRIKESLENQQRLFQSFAKMSKILAQYGYTDGILAGDVLVGEDGGIYIHDYNFRRGGRSYLEALTSLLAEQGFFETQITINIPPLTGGNLERFRLYTKICEALFNKYGIIPYSTAFGYFGGDHDSQKPDFLKFKLACHVEQLSHLPRSEQLNYVQNLVLTELMRNIVEINTKGNVWPPYAAYEIAALYPKIGEIVKNKRGGLNCIDIGTGSGVLAVTGGKWFSDSTWTITDLNPQAIETAISNWINNGLQSDRIVGLVADKISNELIEIARKKGGFDFLVANLPQQPLVDGDDLWILREQNPAAWNVDPSADPDGLGIFISVVSRSPEIMKAGGVGIFCVSSKQNRPRWRDFLNGLVAEQKIKRWEIASSIIYKIPDSYDPRLIEHWITMQEKDGVTRIFKGDDGNWYYIHYNLMLYF